MQDYRTGLWTCAATVLKRVASRSYEVKTDTGYILRRNRRALRKDLTDHIACRPEVDPDLLEDTLNKELAMDQALARPSSGDNPEVSNSATLSPVPLRRSTRTVQRPARLIECK